MVNVEQRVDSLGKMSESEKLLERKLAAGIIKLGGWSIKILSIHINGLPDRLCMIPQGRVFFAEIKTTKKKPSRIQLVVHEKLRKLGFAVHVIDNSEQLNSILDYYEEAI